MGSFSFKSVGTTESQASDEQLTTTAVPIGIRTPLALGNNSFLTMHTNLSSQINDNLRNLIMTNWGERLCQYNIGANLRPLLTDLVSQDDFDTEAIVRIKSAVQRWMPYVDLQDFISVADHIENKQTAVIRITITYNVPSIGLSNRKLEVALYAI